MYIINNIVLISVVVLLINAQHNPNFKHNRRVIVQLFEWKFTDIATECETFLGKNHFAGVQVKNILCKIEEYKEFSLIHFRYHQ